MITGRQIRAARSLLEWKADDLAKKAGLTRVTVSKIEADLVQPQEKTMASIIRAFDLHGVEFLEDEGVRVRKNQLRVFSGKTGYKQYLDHIYLALKDAGGRICQFNLSDSKNLPYADEYAAEHMARMEKIEGLDARVLTIHGDHSFPAKYCAYRWLDQKNKVLIPYYVYGDYVSMSTYKSHSNIQIVSIYSKLLSARYVDQFNLFWDSAIIPDKKGAK